MTVNDKGPQVEIMLHDVYKTYVMGEVKVQVLKGINLDIYKGQLTAILGTPALANRGFHSEINQDLKEQRDGKS
jgi:predicted ABC-type transport system involved in lysophospholipase L1 biosynthesis ATPase subunit